MAKRKVKRYADEGYVTSEDSNAGMKDAYDEAALERVNASEESQAIANEAKGDTILKAMRDQAAKPKVKATSVSAPAAKPKVADTGDETSRLLKRAPKPTPKSQSTSASSESSTPSTVKKETYRDFSGKVQVKKPKEVDDRPSPISRFFSAIRERGMKSNPDAYSKGGTTASKRADGIAQRGKTRGKMY